MFASEFAELLVVSLTDELVFGFVSVLFTEELLLQPLMSAAVKNNGNINRIIFFNGYDLHIYFY